MEPRPSLWQRARRIGRHGLDWFPLTGLGALVIAVGAAGLTELALGELDLVWLMIGAGILGLGALGIVLVIVVALILKLTLRPSSLDGVESIETDRFVPTGYGLRALGWLPLLRVRGEWEEPSQVEVGWRGRRGRLIEVVRVRRRGEIRGVRRRILVQDVLGLARVGFRQRDPLSLDVFPHAGRLRHLPTLTTFAGGDDLTHPFGADEGDRVEIRRYVRGDPARLIHWKIYGRTRQLMVRLPERSLSVARRVVAYLVCGEGDEPTAAAARVAIELRAFGDDWIFGADGTAGKTSETSTALHMVLRSHAGREGGALGLDSFLSQVEREGPAASILFVPQTEGPWLARVVAVAKRRPHRVRVVIGTDGLPNSRGGGRWTRWLFRNNREASSVSPTLNQVVDTLARHRIPVSIVDRVSGRVLRELSARTGIVAERAA